MLAWLFYGNKKEQFLRGIFFFWYNVPSEMMAKLDSIDPKDLGKPKCWNEYQYCIERDDF